MTDSTLSRQSRPELEAAKLAVQEFQVRRLKRDFRDLRMSPEYGPFSDFFASDIYSARDFTERNESFRRLTNQFQAILGQEIYEGLIRLLDLHALTDRLDDELAKVLIDMGVPTQFTESQYEAAYRQLDNYDERYLQIELIIESLEFTHRISQMTFIGVVLKSARIATGLFSKDRTVELLDKAYRTLRDIRNIDPLVHEIRSREITRLDRIFDRTDGSIASA